MAIDLNKRYTKSELLELEPLDLLDLLTARMKVHIPDQITSENQVQAATELSKAMQYETYLSEIADRADLYKRKFKIAGDKDNSNLMQMRENVLKGHASRMKRSYDAISRLFTIKNQELQEMKLLGLTS
ncbi:hypothetical protein [Streptococcus gallolyticus]|uniref:hypothetical protein n=1 Tax=Streptococcus gallolyticus TaxID=315405 RepID=UPI002283F6C7|nr:hypothetical protein [Streptococcus gallolyticus]MCY7187296.1 hypothetical protein [Streptococcus gallolyticus subsp. gallolyticus]